MVIRVSVHGTFQVNIKRPMVFDPFDLPDDSPHRLARDDGMMRVFLGFLDRRHRIPRGQNYGKPGQSSEQNSSFLPE
jgi:hypothetical protein